MSYEPALGPVDFGRFFSAYEPLIHWVVIGGESGSGARAFAVEWAERTVSQCEESGVAVFVKQLGAAPAWHLDWLHLKDRKGGDMSEWPADLRVRQWPVAVAAEVAEGGGAG